MTRARLWLLLLLTAFLPACALDEPINGCVLAAANRREVLMAKSYLHPALSARILCIAYPARSIGHAALIYRLPEGWFAYDDVYGSRPLGLPNTQAFPDALAAAHAAFPARAILTARWYTDARR